MGPAGRCRYTRISTLDLSSRKGHGRDVKKLIRPPQCHITAEAGKKTLAQGITVTNLSINNAVRRKNPDSMASSMATTSLHGILGRGYTKGKTCVPSLLVLLLCQGLLSDWIDSRSSMIMMIFFFFFLNWLLLSGTLWLLDMPFPAQYRSSST
jgi:hypothetical protein